MVMGRRAIELTSFSSEDSVTNTDTVSCTVCVGHNHARNMHTQEIHMETNSPVESMKKRKMESRARTYQHAPQTQNNNNNNQMTTNSSVILRNGK